MLTTISDRRYQVLRVKIGQTRQPEKTCKAANTIVDTIKPVIHQMIKCVQKTAVENVISKKFT